MASGEAEEVTGEARPQRKKKAKKRRDSSQQPAAALPGPGYAVGQVAGSLRRSEGSAGPLAFLFSKVASPAPIYAPAPPAPKKEPAAPTTLRRDSAPKPPPAKKPKALPASEVLLSAREETLQEADQQEEQRELLTREKRKERRQATPGEPGDEAQRLRNKAEERIKNKRTVFVGNLPVSYTKQALRGLFRDFGAIESVRFRSVARAEPTLNRKVAAIQRQVHPKRKSLHAYVVFKEEAAAAKALARNGAQVEGGFNIRVDRATGGDRGHDNRRSAFVGNLPYDLEDQALRDHFAQCGEVEAVRIIRDRETGAGKGFGYVLFAGTDGVQLAMKLDSSELMGRKLRVKRCMQQDGPAGTGLKKFAGYRHSEDSKGKERKKKSAGSTQPRDSKRTEGKTQPAKFKHSKKSGGNKPTKQRFPKKKKS